MNDQIKTLTLKCPSCGAALEVTPDMDSFSCGYCGTEQIVQRRGGTVALKLLSDAVAKVQTGTDRTAAELAIRRLRDDLADIEMQRQQRLAQDAASSNQAGQTFVFGLGLGFVAFLCFSLKEPLWGLLSAIFAILCVILALVGPIEQQKETLRINQKNDARKAAILVEIAEHERLLKKPNEAALPT